MKKIFVLFFVIVVVFSCVVPFASADTLTGGSETIESPYTFNGILPSFTGIITFNSDLSRFPVLDGGYDNYLLALFNNLRFDLIQNSSGGYTLDFSLANYTNTVVGALNGDFNKVGFSLSYSADSSLNTSSFYNRELYFRNNFISDIGSSRNTAFTVTDIVYNTESLRFLSLKTEGIDSNGYEISAYGYLVYYHMVQDDFDISDLYYRTTSFDNNTNSAVIRYYDYNGRYFQLRFPSNINTSTAWLNYWSNRYISDLSSLLTMCYVPTTVFYYPRDLVDNDYYQLGYDEGEKAGYEKGKDEYYQIGVDAGVEAGRILGFNEAYDKALLEVGNFTFTGLISSVFDVPIKAFRGLLDFNVLGVDMAQFVLSLFSLSLIIVVIRFMLAR